MVKAGKVENVKFDVGMQSIKVTGTIESEENMFEYELSAPVDSYSAQNGNYDWNPNLTNSYKKLGLRGYTWTKINGLNDAIMKSQNSLIDLLRFYEGHGENYEAKTNYKDNINVSTYGFGLTTTAMKAIGNYDTKNKTVINKPTTQVKAYEQLLKYLNDVSLVETKRYLGSVKYDSLPDGIKEALLDYHFKNGYQIMQQSKLRTKIEAAVQANTSEKWAAVLKELVYAKPASTNASKEDNPGIYRRSLSRVILAAIDLKKKFPDSKDIAVIDNAVKEVYEGAVRCSKANGKKGLTEIEEIYKAYLGRTLPAEPEKKSSSSNNSGNVYTVPTQITLYSAAGALIPDSLPDGIDTKELRKKIVDEIISLNSIPTNGVDEEGYPKTGALAQGMRLVLPSLITMDNSAKVRLKSPTGWESVSGQPSQNDESVDDSDINGDAVRVLDLLKEECSAPVYSDIGKDKALKCATYEYTVQEGDTIYALALRYGVDWKTLLSDNKMTLKSVLKVGQKIKINKIVYSVKQGDTLTKIAKKYGLTVDYLQDINNLEDVNALKAGQILEIPGYIYTIKKGDNLTQIAKQAGIDVNELVKINGLTSPNNIKENDRLLILFNDDDYNVSETNKVKSRDDEGNEVVTISSDNSLLKGRPLLRKNKVNGKCVASREVLLPTKSGRLSGRTIIVNAGHGYMPSGSMDNGAPGLRGREPEALINYDNAMRLIQKLRDEGAKVIYLQGYEGKSKYGADLISQEIKKSRNKADLFISLHTNSSPTPPAVDRAEIYYHRDSRSSDGRRLAGLFETKLDRHQGRTNYAESKPCGYQVLRTAKNMNMPAILWEVAFINNKTGSDRLNDSKLMSKYADMLTESVIEYFGGKSTSATTPTTPEPAKNKKTHTVKKGDTLDGIAKKYKVTVANLKKWNGLKGDKIVIGQTLIVGK